MKYALLPLLLCMACSPPADDRGPSLPLGTCVPGDWIQSRQACADGIFCEGDPAAAECAASDCEEIFLIYLSTDQTYWEGVLIHSPGNRQFTRWVSDQPEPWSLDGQTLILDTTGHPTTCNEALLYWGDGPYADPWQRPDQDLQSGLDDAHDTDSWTAVSY